MKACLLFVLLPLPVLARIHVVATTTDIASIVREVAKDRAEVGFIVKGTQDPHHVEAKPSFMVKMRDADLVIAHGLELEAAWLEPLVKGSRNPKLQNGKQGILELAASLSPIEIPRETTTRADGDVHPGGNPHFHLDPIRLGDAAVLIARRLGEIAPADKVFFTENANKYRERLATREKEWQDRIKKTGISELITYHKSFSYFCSRFEITCALQLEPKPGVPPSASHLLEVASRAKERKLKVVLIENLYSDAAGEKLKTSAPELVVARVPVSVEGEPAITNGEQLIERLVLAVEGKK